MERITRREFGELVLVLGLAAFGINRAAGADIFSRLEDRDPYRNIFLNAYLDRNVSVDLETATLRTAPMVDPSSLRANNAEAFVKGEIPPGFIEIPTTPDTPPETKAILGEIVEVNNTSVVEDQITPTTNRKSTLVRPVIVHNPGIVTPLGTDRQWVVLNTSLRVPEGNQPSYPNNSLYEVIHRTFFVELNPHGNNAVQILNDVGNPLLIPVSYKQDGTHIDALNQPIKNLGQVILSNQ